MYAIVNGERFSDINRIEMKDAHETVFPGIVVDHVDGVIGVYCEDGFHLCDEDPADYDRVICLEESLVLTSRAEDTEPGGDPEPDEIELLKQQIEDLKAQNEMLTECIFEIADILYN